MLNAVKDRSKKPQGFGGACSPSLNLSFGKASIGELGGVGLLESVPPFYAHKLVRFGERTNPQPDSFFLASLCWKGCVDVFAITDSTLPFFYGHKVFLKGSLSGNAGGVRDYLHTPFLDACARLGGAVTIKHHKISAPLFFHEGIAYA